MKITSSVIVARALGKRPDGIPTEEHGNCAYCGLDIATGDACVPFSAGSAFMDDLSLASRGSLMTCGHCAVLMGAEALRETSHGVFSLEEGAKPFRKWADIGRALTAPPRGAFVAVYATANNQHMAWRAPVNFSRDMFYVRVGLRDLRIRRKAMLDAVDSAVRIADFMGRKPTAKSLANPFAVLSSDLKDSADAHGKFIFQGDKATFAEAARALPSDFKALLNLSLGETWGLRFLMSPNAGQTEDTSADA